MIALLLACVPPTALPQDAPARLGSPETSFQARPAWADAGYAPALDDGSVDALPSRRKAEAVDDALLACTVQSLDHEVVPRLRVRAAYGAWVQDADHSVWTEATEPSDAMTVGVPLVSLVPGDPVVLEVWDSAQEPAMRLGYLTYEWVGQALQTETRHLAGACHVVSRSTVEQRAAELIQVAATQAQGFRGTPDLDTRDLACGSDAVEAALHAPAAWLGWDDPRITGSVLHYEAARLRCEADRGAALRALELSLPVGQAELDGVQVRVDDFECHGALCQMRLAVTNARDTQISVPTVQLVDRAANQLSAQWMPVVLEPGDSLASTVQALRMPVYTGLVRVWIGDQGVWVRVEPELDAPAHDHDHED